MTEQKPVQSKTTMIIVSLFLGGLGIDRLMLGYSNWWLKLITLGGCGIWALIDLINIITGNLKMADGRDLV
ncbi:TM2 domain-containing protein [Ornithobacterium rhinotracheale]|uniref:TM2 domain-containing protein n=1 Tax=Ornithobacterium rhinotracheale TaxID=28251 RepID=UPI001FF1A807|nr:TM2 domain-containing protein [Ornithobacterium rhinotracheale]MCK0204213.1 TM2 domain-containing protein [Ornithobacterium rhinotracheale]